MDNTERGVDSGSSHGSGIVGGLKAWRKKKFRAPAGACTILQCCEVN